MAESLLWHSVGHIGDLAETYSRTYLKMIALKNENILDGDSLFSEVIEKMYQNLRNLWAVNIYFFYLYVLNQTTVRRLA